MVLVITLSKDFGFVFVFNSWKIPLRETEKEHPVLFMPVGLIFPHAMLMTGTWYK